MKNYQGENVKAGLLVNRSPRAHPHWFEVKSDHLKNYCRRLLDIVGSIFLIILAAVPMAAIMMIIKFSSPGPVFFSQRRFGLWGRVFKVFKFRTMYETVDGIDTGQVKPGDPRITTVGRVLRRMSLDELPQLFNVLMGHMTFVGPRPHSIALNERYRDSIAGYMRRYDVKPGITGWSQVNGYRGQTPTKKEMAKRVEYDLWYIRNRSLWLDAKIILKTAFVVFNDKNAC